MPPENQLSSNLRLIRKKRWKLTQDQFADLMASTRSRINSYENGGIEPSIEFMILLQNFTSINIEDIYYLPLSLDDIPPLPNKGAPKPVDDPTPDYIKQEGTELIDYDKRIKTRLKVIEDRLHALEQKNSPSSSKDNSSVIEIESDPTSK